MTYVTNTFEGGTDGATLSPANSGGVSGTPFDGIQGPPAGAFCQYSKAKYYDDKLSMRIGIRGTGNFCGPYWTTTSLGTPPNDWYGRFLINTDVLAATNDAILLLETAALATQGDIQFLADGRLAIRNAAGSTIATTTAALVAGKWYRIELKFHGDTSAGYMGLQLYSDPKDVIGSTLDSINWTGGTATWAMASATTGRTTIGFPSFSTNWPSSTGFCYFDHLAMASPTQIGPPGRIKDPLMPKFALPPTRSF